ncbi:MAG: TolC family protein [Steroidobacteraceae bacterium]
MSSRTRGDGAPLRECADTRRCAIRSSWGVGALAVLAVNLAGCAVYHDKPLPAGPDWVGTAALRVPASRFGLAGLTPAPLDPRKGFTAINLMELALAGDPQLKAARSRAAVAGAQLLAAGLLPDPQIAAGLSRSPLHTGYSVGLMEDVRTLVTMHAAEQAAAAHARQVNLEILWQEWQVAARARELFVQARELRRLRAVLAPERRLLNALINRSAREVAHGAITSGQLAAAIAEWTVAERQWRALGLQDNLAWHQIDGLLGLRPGTRLRLRGGPRRRPLSSRRFRAVLGALPRRRPDLLALAAGYRSAEASLRVQILRQFPMIGVGVQRAEAADDAVHTYGFDVTLTLPLFNRNRGAIAVARASRAYLYQVYQSDVDTAMNQAHQLFAAERILRRQLRAAQRHLAQVRRMQTAAHASFERGELGLSSYTAVLTDVDAARMQRIALRASLEQTRAALSALLMLPP